MGKAPQVTRSGARHENNQIRADDIVANVNNRDGDNNNAGKNAVNQWRNGTQSRQPIKRRSEHQDKSNRNEDQQENQELLRKRRWEVTAATGVNPVQDSQGSRSSDGNATAKEIQVEAEFVEDGDRVNMMIEANEDDFGTESDYETGLEYSSQLNETSDLDYDDVGETSETEPRPSTSRKKDATHAIYDMNDD